MAKFEIVPGLTFVSRSSWGADSAHPRLGHSVPRTDRTHVFIHHTVRVDKDSTPSIWENEGEIFAEMRKLQTCRPDLGLDVPYNFVAFMTSKGGKNLYICEGRGEDRSGAHTVGHNRAAIAVSFGGDFHNGPIAAGEVAARMPLLSKFLGWLRHDPSHPSYGTFDPMTKLETKKPPKPGRKVWFHRDVKNTDCPGKLLEAELPKVDFARP